MFGALGRFREFIEGVLLRSVTQNIVIFIDEIDSVLSLNFPTDDFFAFIRGCYNQRVDQPAYHRLTFALLGVATPSDLIRDKKRTPFNIGRAIELNGFELHEAKPLAQGLVNKVSNTQKVLKEVLSWTGGQPFLTQKLCQLVRNVKSAIPAGAEAQYIEKLVRSRLIENWEAQDDPEHLRTIRDRILSIEHNAGRLLVLYQHIWQRGEVAADGSSEQMALCLSGLVVKYQGKLRVYNPIYESIFNQRWVNKALANLRPYSEAIAAWLDSNCQDESRLLRRQRLKEALAWANNKSLSPQDYQFLNASQALERREFEETLEKFKISSAGQRQEQQNKKLDTEVVNQTLSMMDIRLNSGGFDVILSEMLHAITLKTGELLNADRATIFLLDEEKNELWTLVAKGDNGIFLEIRTPVGQGIAGEVAQKREVVNIPYDLYDDPRSSTAKEQDKKTGYRTYTLLTLPLLNEQGNLVAVFQLLNKLKQSHAPDAPLFERVDTKGFTPDDEKLFAEFARSIQLILKSSQLFYKAAQKQRAAVALMTATQSLGQSSLDLERTLTKVMDEAQKLMNADRATVWLLDYERDELWAKIRIADGTLGEIRIPREAGFAGQVATTGQPLIIPFDMYDHPDSQISKQTDKKTGYRTCSLLCMPVYNAAGELIGVTQLINKKKQGDFPSYNSADWPKAPDCWKASFDRSDLEFMEAFNIQAGVALQNAKLFSTVKQQQQEQLDLVFNVSSGVIFTDKTGHISLANEPAKYLLGLSDIEGKSVRDLIRLKEGDFAKWFDAALAAKGEKARQQDYPNQTLLSHTTEEQHSVNLCIISFANASDPTQVSGTLVIINDSSDEKQKQEQRDLLRRVSSGVIFEEAASA
jgi:GAF domain-containing protein